MAVSDEVAPPAHPHDVHIYQEFMPAKHLGAPPAICATSQTWGSRQLQVVSWMSRVAGGAPRLPISGKERHLLLLQIVSASLTLTDTESPLSSS